MKFWLRAAVMVVLAVLLVGAARPAMAAITPPTQPASGPGGADYKWGNPTFVHHDVWWNDDLDYWTFEPANWQGPGTRPANAPVVVFNHGWNGNDPVLYWASLVHLARKGNIVIFPKYQNWFTNAQYFTSNAIWSVKDGIAWMQWWATVKPNTALGMQLIGHSAGGAVSVNMANQWQSQGLPQPRAIVPVEPWDGNAGQYMDTSLSGIPSTTIIDCIVTDEDNVVGRLGCDAIWNRSNHIPGTKRNYIWMFSDRYGDPDLVANHFTGNDGALAFYGVWKLADGSRDCAMFGTNCAYALGNTTQQRYMGLWSDGRPVRQLQVTTTKPPCPAGSLALGCV